jgi:Na+/H+ antiporter NhaC
MVYNNQMFQKSLPKPVLIFFFLLVRVYLFGQIEIIQTDTFPTNEKQITDTIGLSSFDFVVSRDSIFMNVTGEGILRYHVNGEERFADITSGLAPLADRFDEVGQLLLFKTLSGYKLFHISRKDNEQYRIRSVPFYLSVVPPLIAILCALLLKEVLISLFLGIWAGVFILGGLRLDSFYMFVLSFWKVIQVHVINALTDSGHLSIIVFSMLIGGMVALISKNGGMAGVVQKLSGLAKNKKSSQFVTWLMGIVVFFDDYANTLVVGNTMRPITDKFKVSREKLSYLVDSTAAPIAAIAFITTWIGAQLAYIQSGIGNISLGVNISPYALYFSSLQFSFYPFLTILFMLMIIKTGKEYGPMYHAEVRAQKGQVSSNSQQADDEPNMEDLSPVKGARLHWSKAAIPVIAVVAVTIFALLETGFTNLFQQYFPTSGNYSWSVVWQKIMTEPATGEQGFFVQLGRVIGAADSYIALLWASTAGLILAIVMTLADKTMKLFHVMHWVTVGFKTMLPALLILTLAWALASVTKELHTAEFISLAIAGNISPVFMPSLIFILSFLIAFSTGSSWSTMAILYPIAIPATYAVCMQAGLDQASVLTCITHVISVVLAAAVFGDHCSPISDTTILSSLASDCNHLDHVKTQIPYAMTVGGVSLVLSFLAAWLNAGFIVNLLLFVLGAGALFMFLTLFGKKVSEEN